MAKQDSGSKTYIFHQYIMLHPILNHRGGIALEEYFCWRTYFLHSSSGGKLSYYKLFLQGENFRLEISAWPDLSYLKKTCMNMCNQLCKKEWCPIVNKEPAFNHILIKWMWLHGAGNTDRLWGYLPDHVGDRSFPWWKHDSFFVLSSIFRGKNCFSLFSQVCPEQYDKGSRCI